MQSIFRLLMSRPLVTTLTLCLILAAALPVLASDASFKTVGTETLKEMLDAKIGLTLLDARTKEEYREAHIVNALHVAEREFEKKSPLLPSDHGALLVVYCNGVKCGKSKKVAAKAKAAGFTNVMIYSEGFPVWEEKGLPITAGADYEKRVETAKMSAEELAKVIQENNSAYVVVDVRDEFEYADGHITSAINIAAETFAANSAVLPRHKNIVVYCTTGRRSYAAYRKLMRLAYPHIYETVFAEWKEAGFPIAKSEL